VDQRKDGAQKQTEVEKKHKQIEEEANKKKQV
jgi:hypothetical protein